MQRSSISGQPIIASSMWRGYSKKYISTDQYLGMDRPFHRSRGGQDRGINAPRNHHPKEALSRVPCRYYNTVSGYCRLHLCDISLIARCNRGTDCWFMHENPSRNTSSTPAVGTDTSDIVSSPAAAETSLANMSVDATCGICLEVPTKFGLMVNCSHVFCIGILPGEFADCRLHP